MRCFAWGRPWATTAGWRPGDLSFLVHRLGRGFVAGNPRRDLYILTTRDRGQTWSLQTMRLPAPVNSAHEERSPCLMQDSDGRYVLLFTSDRNLAHAHVVYACWSEDLVNFSAPVMVAPDPGRPACIRQRSDGTYLAYLYTFNKDLGFRELVGGLWQRPVAVCTSTDLVNWTRPKEIIGAKRPAESFNAIEDGGNFIAPLQPCVAERMGDENQPRRHSFRESGRHSFQGFPLGSKPEASRRQALGRQPELQRQLRDLSLRRRKSLEKPAAASGHAELVNCAIRRRPCRERKRSFASVCPSITGASGVCSPSPFYPRW